MIKFKLWEKLAFESLHYHTAEPWADADILFEGYHRRALFLESWLLKKKIQRGGFQPDNCNANNPYLTDLLFAKNKRFSVALGNGIIAQYHWRVQSTHMSYNNPMCRFFSASDLF